MLSLIHVKVFLPTAATQVLDVPVVHWQTPDVPFTQPEASVVGGVSSAVDWRLIRHPPSSSATSASLRMMARTVARL